MNNLRPGGRIRFYPKVPFRATVWSKLWFLFLQLPDDIDRFQYVADRIGSERIRVAAVLGDPDLIDIEEMSDLALAFGAWIDFKLEPAENSA